MNLIQVIVLSLVQGVTELFPVSSLGHSVIIKALIAGNLSNDPHFLAFVVTLHLGTSIALVIYFWNDWVKIFKSFLNVAIKGKFSNSKDERLMLLLVTGTIPVGILGVIFEKKVKIIFNSPFIASIFLVLNGFILLFIEGLKKIDNKGEIDKLSFKNSFLIGLSQSLALIPGISRSGISMASSLVSGLSHEESARFSFMLATPVILAASLLEIPTLRGASSIYFLYAILGGVISGVTAYLSTKFLLKYFLKGNLKPFAYYSIIAGIIFTIKFA